ncbi:MAG TPA: ribokinase [Candidatus Limnocylindrales bacterium]|nr:ribokinase [Candidatus Limnocylindrales bacterium]
MSGRVIVVGSVNVDLVAHAEHLPAPGETITGATFSEHDGGKGANQAVAAVRLGAVTAFVGAVGRDAYGLRARAALTHEGIDLTGLRTVDGPTGVALILVDARGENMISVASGANAALTAANVTEGIQALAPTTADVVLVGHEIPTLAAKHALRLGRSAGSTTVFNPAPAAGVDRSVFGLADVLTVNRLELGTIVAADGARTGRPGAAETRPVEAARTLLQPNADGDGVATAVVVTLGAGGAIVVTRDGDPIDLPAREVGAIDAVGAGDTFAGALAAGLAAGQDVAGAARRAVAAASISTRRAGAREGMPTVEELATFLDV